MEQILNMVQQAGEASRELALLSSVQKETILLAMADALVAQQQSILTANAQDLAAAEQEGKGKAFLDRLALSTERIAQMAEGMRQVARLQDPGGGDCVWVDGTQRHSHFEKTRALWRGRHDL